MALILVGCNSFIAQHVERSANRQGIALRTLPHNVELSGELKPEDIVVNFAMHPAFRSQNYASIYDVDAIVARAAMQSGARFVMLSTRRVYPASARWQAREDNQTGGDETAYGRNKARSEEVVGDLTAGRALILRLSNVFGFEYAAVPRKTFLGQMLSDLRSIQTIRFDMSPDTRRDFMPVEACARAILIAAQSGVEGVFNLGAGFPLRCGDLADWIIDGYGQGQVESQPDIRDEYYLDMTKWKRHFALVISPNDMPEYCLNLGTRLRNA